MNSCDLIACAYVFDTLSAVCMHFFDAMHAYMDGLANYGIHVLETDQRCFGGIYIDIFNFEFGMCGKVGESTDQHQQEIINH